MRLKLIWLALLVTGGLLWALAESPALRVFGIGLWFPGLGFLALGWWGIPLVLLSIALFYVALFSWYTTANLVAPPAVWLTSALISAAVAPRVPLAETPWIAAAIVALYATRNYRNSRTAHKARVAKGLERSAYLERLAAAAPIERSPVPDPTTRELALEDLQASRYALDRGLQPLDKFDGFTIIEQFQMSSLRYQLNFLQWALALMQCHYTPNFHGYLSQAQRNLIEKFQDKRVWGYWIYEAMFGLLRFDFNPIGRENIMLGGFMNINVLTYMNNTGDMRYAEKAAFRFRLNGRKVYEHDAHTLNDTARRNFMESKVGLYGCEPHWSFPYCNLLGLSGLPVYDQVFGTKTTPTVRQRFSDMVKSEFTLPDGSLSSGLSQVIGLSVPSRGSYSMIAMAWLANPNFPALARDFWAIVRKETVSINEAGELEVNKTGPFDSIDVGNYRRNEGYLVSLIGIAAYEMGDYQIADAALARLDRTCGPVEKDGYKTYDISGFAHAHAVIARIIRRDDWRNMVRNGPVRSALAGPVLEEASYPDVLVARAFSNGHDLSLVLHPGRAPGAQPIGVSRLVPRAGYRIEGALNETLAADDQGWLRFAVPLDGRTEVKITPLATGG